MKFGNIFAGLRSVFTNDPASFGAEIVDETLAGRIRASQTGTLRTYIPYMLLANMIVAIVLTLAMASSSQMLPALIWSAGITVFALFAFLVPLRGRTSARNYETKAAVNSYILLALVHSCIWAAFPVLFMAPTPAGAQLIVIAIAIGVISVGTVVHAAVPGAAIAFITPVVVALLASFHIHEVAFGNYIGLLLALFSFVLIRAAFAQATMLAARIITDEEQRKKSDMISMLLGEFEENASDWLWETDSLGRLAYISTKFSEMANLPLETLKGKSLLRVMARGSDGPPEPANSWRAITECLHQRTPFRDLALQIWVEGEPRWCEMTGRPIYGETGSFVGFRGFCTDVTKKRADEEKIAYLASFDAVTALPNRVSFGEKIKNSYRQLARTNTTCALHCIDLDGFKEINDTFGHAIGDAFLQECARRISACLSENDFVARLGGDEFSVIQADTQSDYHAAKLAKAIIAAVSMPFTVAGSTMKAGASIGIAFAPKDGDSPETLMVNGDLALYRAKSDGRGIFRFYDSSMDESARERRKIEAELRTAIENDEFKLLFQPILNVETDSIGNCESLLRWDNPSLGSVSPADFVPIAEECGLIIPIGEWVIQEACRQASRWPDHIKVAVNLSPVQFQSPGLLPVIMKALEATGLEAHRLEIEITETVLVSNIERVLAIIDTLERLGVRIALDDFGTGYSSLAYIRQINFDKIKIDASFVRDMIDDKSCAAIIRAVTGLARELGIRITAEGVETEEQLAALKAEGCAEMQGYLISRPLPAKEFAAFIEKPDQAQPVTAQDVA